MVRNKQDTGISVCKVIAHMWDLICIMPFMQPDTHTHLLTDYKKCPSDCCHANSVAGFTCVHSSTAPHNWVDGEN